MTGTCDPQQYYTYIEVKSIRSVGEHGSTASFSNIFVDVQKAYDTVCIAKRVVEQAVGSWDKR